MEWPSVPIWSTVSTIAMEREATGPNTQAVLSALAATPGAFRFHGFSVADSLGGQTKQMRAAAALHK